MAKSVVAVIEDQNTTALVVPGSTAMVLPGDALFAPTIPDSPFAPLRAGLETFHDVLEELAPGHTPPLPTTGIPAGGGRSFDFLIGEESLGAAAKVQVVILFHAFTRQYYRDSYDQVGKQPPTCWSPNRLNGYGDNGQGFGEHDCNTCKLSKWTSTGKGAARVSTPPPCNATGLLYLLTPFSEWPVVMRLPRTSVVKFETYMDGLVARPNKPKAWQVVCEFSLDKIQGRKAAYSVLEVEYVRDLTADERAIIGGNTYPQTIRRMFQPYFAAAQDPDRFMQRKRDAMEADFEAEDVAPYDIPDDGKYDADGLQEI
jgi:hypothetical protein